jgi:peptide-methionine (S)-S-oxide reductase
MDSTVPLVALTLLVTVAACRAATTSASPQPDSRPAAPSVASTMPARTAPVGTDPGHVGDGTPLTPRDGDELAAFAAGCFWGVEDTFRHVPGVVATAVGFTGGHVDHPNYPLVCTHTTGHAETVLVEFDPKLVSYDTLLRVFFKNHDPTTFNRQGPDVGDQYRSAVFTFSPEQAAAAKAAREREQKALGKTVVTEITPIGKFWKAEGYHQQYDEKTGTHSCPLPKGLAADGT